MRAAACVVSFTFRSIDCHAQSNACPIPLSQALRLVVLSHCVHGAQTIPSSSGMTLRCTGAQRSGAKRTLGVLAAADLDELLDIGNFGRHFGGGGWSSR